MTKEEILRAVGEYIASEREDKVAVQDYHPVVAGLWETYLRGGCVSPGADVNIGADTVGVMMALYHIGRQAVECQPNPVVFAAIAAEAIVAGEIATE